MTPPKEHRTLSVTNLKDTQRAVIYPIENSKYLLRMLNELHEKRRTIR